MKKNLFFVLLLCSVLQGTSQTPAEIRRPQPIGTGPNRFGSGTTRRSPARVSTPNSKRSRNRQGYGGVSILPFGAKSGPKYLSPEYFDLYEYTAGKAETLGMQLSLYDEYGFPSGSGGAISADDDVPRFRNRFPNTYDEAARQNRRRNPDGGATYVSPVSKTQVKLMAAVAMNADTKERIDLSGNITEGAIVWKVPEGRWKIMQFVCVERTATRTWTT